ncbi:MAG: hypothetical protein ACI4RD_04440 [Kiritimatiellia bacterium]
MNKIVGSLSMSVVAAVFCRVSAYGESAAEGPLTLAYAREVWNAPYDNSVHKFDVVSKVMNRVTQAERDGGTNRAEIAAIETYFLDAVLRTTPATLDDTDKVAGKVWAFAQFFGIISQWNCMRNRGNLMRVAKTVARFKPLPEFDVRDAKPYARKVDDFLQYGTNKPPQRFGVVRLWTGPTCERIIKVAGFRKIYNKAVDDMRLAVTGACQMLIFRSDIAADDADRMALWNEFQRVSDNGGESAAGLQAGVPH